MNGNEIIALLVIVLIIAFCVRLYNKFKKTENTNFTEN